MAHIERILQAAEKHPWALMPEKFGEIAAILAAKAESGQIPNQSEIDAADARARGESRNIGGTVAVLPMFGTISRRMGMLGAMSGGLSVESFSKAFQELVDDESDDVGAKVFAELVRLFQSRGPRPQSRQVGAGAPALDVVDLFGADQPDSRL